MSNLSHISDHERFEARERVEPESKGAQLEDGYVRTANAIVEALCKAPLTSREARIVRAVERATFGWDRPAARLSQSVMAKMTGLTPKRCSESVNALLAKKVLRRDGGSQAPIGINTRVSEWNFDAQKARVSPKRQQEPNWGLRPQDGDEKRPQDGDTNTDTTDNLEPKGSKESSKKSRPKKWGEPVDHEIAEWMAEIVDDLPGGSEKRNMAAWANDIRLMRERDARDPEHIRRLFEWASQDDFWCSNILSPAKFRKQWKTLAIQFNRDRTGASHANRHSTDSRRAEQDRIAASLANPYDTSWADGLFDEGGAEVPDRNASKPSVHADGGDFPEDVANVIHYGRNAEASEAGACVINGELVLAADPGASRYGH